MHTPPTVAVLLTQPQCNMFCTFCVTEDSFGVLSLERATDFLREIRAAGTSNVVLGGGEPFFWPHDIVKLASFARSIGFLVQVATNAVALPENFERIGAIDRYVLPLESADAEPHNALRRYREKHHAIVLAALERLADVGKSVTISTVATARNIDVIPDLATFLERYNRRSGNLNAWHIYRFIPEGRGGAVFADDLAVSESAYDDAIAGIRSRNLPFRVYKRSDMYQTQAISFFAEREGRIVRF